MAGQTGAEQALADMREIVDDARGRGAARVVVWGGIAVCAFTAAFASWQYAPPLPVAGLTSEPPLTTASIGQMPTASLPPTARSVGGRAITTVLGGSDLSLLQREVGDIRQEINDLRRGMTRFTVADEQITRRLEALEEQLAILASRLAQALDQAKAVSLAATGTLAEAASKPAPASVPQPMAKPEPARLEPALFETRAGKVAARPLVAESAGGEVARPEAAKAPPPSVAAETKVAAAPRGEPPAVAPVAKDTTETAGSAAIMAKPQAVIAPEPPPPVASGPVTPGTTAAPPTRPVASAADEARRAERAQQAAQVQQLAQQMILGQSGGKGLQLPLPAQQQLAVAAAAAKQEAKGETASDAVVRTTFAVDLGGYKSVAALRKGWAASAAKHAGLTNSLKPLGQMKDTGNAIELRLVAGPFGNAADAAKFCAQVQAAGTVCAPSLYVGQPITP